MGVKYGHVFYVHKGVIFLCVLCSPKRLEHEGMFGNLVILSKLLGVRSGILNLHSTASSLYPHLILRHLDTLIHETSLNETTTSSFKGCARYLSCIWRPQYWSSRDSCVNIEEQTIIPREKHQAPDIFLNILTLKTILPTIDWSYTLRLTFFII